MYIKGKTTLKITLAVTLGVTLGVTLSMGKNKVLIMYLVLKY